MRLPSKLILTFSIIITLLFTHDLSALGQNGHRATGAIAEHFLSDHSQNQIKQILNNESLAEISTYVDEMQSENTPYWKKISKPYHFVTVPDGKTYIEVGAPKQGDAYSALNHYTSILKNKQAARAERALALKWIVHIIGDLHQPLHVGNGLDRGGNQFKVEFFGNHTNLHSVWDSKMLNHLNLSYTELTDWLLRKIEPTDLKQWQSNDPLVWIAESYKIRQTIYPDDPELWYEYPHQHLPTLKKRIQQAGVRIAYYLDQVFNEIN